MTVHLGILDWGIGGVDFYARLRRAHPDLPVTYWSDAGATPYGKQSQPDLAARVESVARELQRRGVTHLVVACNAASTVLDHPRLRALTRSGLPITGVIEPAITAALADPARAFGVVGGKRTITSQVYRRGLEIAGRRVLQRVAQPLSALVERGHTDGPEVRAEIARIFAPLRRVEALVLACTHYTALLPPIRAAVPDARIIDPAAATLAFVTRHWHLDRAVVPARTRPEPGALPRPGTSDMFLTTGDPEAMRRAARQAFGVELAAVDGVLHFG
ncbi:MAG: aspartate/glutamate racemase family protein [Myxococcales bacterium]|nr:aspartate/glutamate racemase family protein [Myxococcales bacterium]